MNITRREFATGVAATTLAARAFAQTTTTCPFRLSVITDEISQDFDHACHVAARDFGLSWVEIRNINGKTLTALSADEISSTLASLKKYNLRVTDLASPLFKSDFPGAPRSKESPTPHDTFSANVASSFSAQEDLLEHVISLCKTFSTERIRCFDFWRLDDPKPYRAEMNHHLIKAAERCGKDGLILLLENEMACNTGSGVEAAATLAAVQNPHFMLNWDPGNSVTFAGDVPFPNDYNSLPKNRIGHVHCKNAIRTPGEKRGFEWRPVDVGLVDWVGQFKALKKDGYRHAVSLETHWHGAPGATPDEVAEASTRISMKGMRECLEKAGIRC